MLFRIYIDEDSCSERLIESLRTAGFDVLTADEAQTRAWTDERQLEFAAKADRVALTANVGDFSRIQGEWGQAGIPHPGIIVWNRSRWSPEMLAPRLLALAESHASDDLANAILYF